MIPLTDPDYLKFVRQLPCSVTDCSTKPCEAHHRIGHNRRDDYGNRVSDYEAMPLCKKHHDELHDHGWRSFEAKYRLNQLKVVISTLIKHLVYQLSDANSPI